MSAAGGNLTSEQLRILLHLDAGATIVLGADGAARCALNHGLAGAGREVTGADIYQLTARGFLKRQDDILRITRAGTRYLQQRREARG